MSELSLQGYKYKCECYARIVTKNECQKTDTLNLLGVYLEELGCLLDLGVVPGQYMS